VSTEISMVLEYLYIVLINAEKPPYKVVFRSRCGGGEGSRTPVRRF